MKLFESLPFQDALDDILFEINPRNILLVKGEKSFKQNNCTSYFESLTKNYNVNIFSVKKSNPQYFDLISEITKYDKNPYDVIIAVGGGSVMDYAKLLKIYLGNFKILYEDFLKIDQLLPLTPLICIPTTAGSGSEATHFAVMYKGKEKYSLANGYLTPNFVVLDSSLTMSLPKYQTACSGMDAICQALESVWSLGATDESRNYSFDALKIIIPNIKLVVNNPDKNNRKLMLKGSFLAGKAINISKTTGPHALAYYLTINHGIPHGEAVGMNVDLFINLNWKHLSYSIANKLLNIFSARTKDDIINYFINLKKCIGLRDNPLAINDINVLEYLNSINTERLSNNPCLPTKEELFKFILKRKPIN